MKDYTNAILLKDMNDNMVDAIIFTNEHPTTIQNAINEARNEYFEMEEKNQVPSYINCLYEYILEHLETEFNLYIVEYWDKRNAVYY